MLETFPLSFDALHKKVSCQTSEEKGEEEGKCIVTYTIASPNFYAYVCFDFNWHVYGTDLCSTSDRDWLSPKKQTPV